MSEMEQGQSFEELLEASFKQTIHVGKIVEGKVIDTKLVQPSNARELMLVTPSGMSIDVRLLQRLKAPLPILVIPSEIVILVKLVQPLNAYVPKVVTLLGMSIVCKPLQL